MTLSVSCPSCGHRLSVPDNFKGEVFRCKQCSAPFRVMAGAPAEQLPVPARPLPGPASEGADTRSVRFNCPRCNSAFETPGSQAGTKFFCTTCGQKVQVPDLPPNKTMLGTVDDDPRNRTTLGTTQPGGFPPPAHVPGQSIPYAEYDAGQGMPPIVVTVNTNVPQQVEPPRRRRFRHDYDDEYRADPPPGGAAMAMGITSMVLGIISLPFAILPCLGYFVLPIAGLGVVFGLIGLSIGAGQRGHQPGFSVAGLATAGAAILLVLIWVVLVPDVWGRRGWFWWGW